MGTSQDQTQEIDALLVFEVPLCLSRTNDHTLHNIAICGKNGLGLRYKMKRRRKNLNVVPDERRT